MSEDDRSIVDIDYVRETLASIGWKYTDVLFGFIGVIVYARVFSQTDFGAAYAVIAAARVIQNLANGVLIGIKKRISEDTSRKSLNQHLTLGVVFIFCFTVICFAGTAIGVRVLDIGTYSEYVYYGALSVGARSMFYLSKQVAAGMGYPSRSHRADTVDGATTLVFRVGLWLFAGFGATAILLGEILSGLLIAIAFLLSMRVYPITVPSLAQATNLYRFARWSSINNFANGLFNQGPTSMLGYLVSPVSAAVYKAGSTLSQPGTVLSGAIAGNLIVKVSQNHTEDTSFETVARTSISVAPAVAIPVLFGAVALGDELMPVVFSGSYTGTGFALVAASVFALMFSIKKPLYSVANGADLPDLLTKVNTIRVFVFLPTLALTMSLYDFTAFLWGVIFVQTVDTAILSHLVKSKTELSAVFDWSLLGPQIVAGGLMYAVIATLDAVYDPVGLISLGVTVGTGGVLYTVVTLAFENIRAEIIENISF